MKNTKNGGGIDGEMNKVICIQGPTGSGKTDLAIELAIKLNTQIISTDSRQFYKELSIGTALPSVEQLSRVKHHFIGCASLNYEITSAHFARIAKPILNELLDKFGYAIIVGGSGLFTDALINGLDDVPVNRQFRIELTEIFKNYGIEPLCEELANLDPVYFDQVDKKNPVRVIRALEAIRQSGKRMSEILQQKNESINYNAIRFAIQWPREVLYERINQRVDKMIYQGLISEVKSLYQYRDLNALNTVGYKEYFQFIDGKITEEKAIELIKQHTRNYAKRQLTWLRRYPDINYLNPFANYTLLDQAMKILKTT